MPSACRNNSSANTENSRRRPHSPPAALADRPACAVSYASRQNRECKQSWFRRVSAMRRKLPPAAQRAQTLLLMNLFVQENRTASAVRKGDCPPGGIARARAGEKQSLSAVSDINQAKARINLFIREAEPLQRFARATARRAESPAPAQAKGKAFLP